MSFAPTDRLRLLYSMERHHRSQADLECVPLLPPEPTWALPGTEEKIRVMEERVANGYQPTHPLDARGGAEEED